MSEADVYRTFSAQGFVQIEVQSLSSREALVVACRDGRRQRLSMDRSFRIGYLGDLGACAPPVGGQLGFNNGQPGFNSGQPGFNSGQPGFNSGQPGFNSGQPGFNSGQPGFNSGQPGFNSGQPGFNSGQQGGPDQFGGGEQLIGEGFSPTGRDADRRVRFEDLQAALRREGFYDPQFRGTYEATACQRDALYRITLQVFSRVDVFQGPYAGACRTFTAPLQRAERPPSAAPSAAPNALAAPGALAPALDEMLRAVEFQRFSAPELMTPIAFSACQNEGRYDMRADFAADGRLLLLRGNYMGRCAAAAQPPIVVDPPIYDPNPDPFPPVPPTALLSDRQLREILFEQGYRRIFFNARSPESIDVDGCFGVRRFEMRLDRADGRISARRVAGFCRLDQGDVEYVPPRPVARDVLAAQTPLDPQTCQQVLNWFQRNSPITFPSGSSTMDPESAESIRRMALGFNRCGDVRVLVEGHTDNVGLPIDNQILSERRASEVANAFITYGVPPERIRAGGFGLEHPLAPNTSPANRALNRRIELTLEWGLF